MPAVSVEAIGGDQVPETLGLFVEVSGKLGFVSNWHNSGIALNVGITIWLWIKVKLIIPFPLLFPSIQLLPDGIRLEPPP